MSDEKILKFEGTPLTRREVLIAREAFDLGVSAVFDRLGEGPHTLFHAWPGSEALAEEEYPLPRTRVPRIVADPEGASFGIASDRRFLKFAVADGEILLVLDEDDSGNGADARMWEKIRPTPARVRLWADLLANPTEEVDDDA